MASHDKTRPASGSTCTSSSAPGSLLTLTQNRLPVSTDTSDGGSSVDNDVSNSTQPTEPIPLTYNHVLLLFPSGRAAWHREHISALTRSHAFRAHISNQALILRNMRDQRAKELDFRQKFITSPTGVPETYYENWKEWTEYLANLDIEGLTKHANEHIAWMKLLEDEYIKAETVWEEFWAIHDEIERGKASAVEDSEEGQNENENENEDFITQATKAIAIEDNDEDSDDSDDSETFTPDPTLHARLAPILATLSALDRKRAFLSSKIIAGNSSDELLAYFGKDAPEWYDWGDVRLGNLR